MIVMKFYFSSQQYERRKKKTKQNNSMNNNFFNYWSEKIEAKLPSNMKDKYILQDKLSKKRRKNQTWKGKNKQQKSKALYVIYVVNGSSFLFYQIYDFFLRWE